MQLIRCREKACNIFLDNDKTIAGEYEIIIIIIILAKRLNIIGKWIRLGEISSFRLYISFFNFSNLSRGKIERD